MTWPAGFGKGTRVWRRLTHLHGRLVPAHYTVDESEHRRSGIEYAVRIPTGLLISAVRPAVGYRSDAWMASGANSGGVACVVEDGREVRWTYLEAVSFDEERSLVVLRALAGSLSQVIAACIEEAPQARQEAPRGSQAYVEVPHETSGLMVPVVSLSVVLVHWRGGPGPAARVVIAVDPTARILHFADGGELSVEPPEKDLYRITRT